MAQDSKDRFPSIPNEAWFKLRRQFMNKIPAAVTHNYITGALGQMTPDSSRANIITPLKIVGLLDNEGKPTELATRWRDDDQYPAVCEEIRNRVYPQELLDLFSDPNTSIESLQRWFANRASLGTSAALKKARFYQLLLKADPAEETTTSKPARPSGGKVIGKKNPPRIAPSGDVVATSSAAVPATTQPTNALTALSANTPKAPSLHIDLQIHISPDASPDQIDKIFESLARHLQLGS